MSEKEIDQKLLKFIHNHSPEQMAKQICEVQPMNEEVGKAIKFLCENDWILTVKGKHNDN